MSLRTLSSVSAEEKVTPKNTRETVGLKQRDLDNNFRYKLYFLSAAGKGLIKKQNITINKSKIYRVPFEIKANEYKAWNDVFRSGNKQIQFGMHLKSATTLFMKIIVDLNVNYRNILHLRNELTDVNPEILFTEGFYKNAGLVQDVIPAGKDKAIIGLRTMVLNDKDEKVVENKDYFMVRNVNKKTMEYLKSQKQEKVVDYKSWLELPKMTNENIIDTDEIYIPKNMGKDYGWVSGDLNFVHTTNFLARLFGYKRAFIQGLCTANYVLANLPDHIRPTNFTINFLKPVYTDSQIIIQYTSEHYQVMDSSKTVLARGRLN